MTFCRYRYESQPPVRKTETSVTWIADGDNDWEALMEKNRPRIGCRVAESPTQAVGTTFECQYPEIGDEYCPIAQRIQPRVLG